MQTLGCRACTRAVSCLGCELVAENGRFYLHVLEAGKSDLRLGRREYLEAFLDKRFRECSLVRVTGLPPAADLPAVETWASSFWDRKRGTSQGESTEGAGWTFELTGVEGGGWVALIELASGDVASQFVAAMQGSFVAGVHISQSSAYLCIIVACHRDTLTTINPGLTSGRVALSHARASARRRTVRTRTLAHRVHARTQTVEPCAPVLIG